MVRVSRSIALAAFALLCAAPAALADSSSSSNRAGYAAHGGHVKFHKVFAAWTQPTLSCTPSTDSYSAFWVGLGGFSQTSQALEQVGTEADCSTSGAAKMTAWYELVPAASKSLKLTIKAGDKIAASLTVTGHRVVVTLLDTTSNKSVTKTLHAPAIDVSSAEWIAEAPSDCSSTNSCQTLPLANFGSTAFDAAGAQATGQRSGAISSKSWGLTKITLEPGGPRFAGFHGSGSAAGSATPSGLTGNGSSFTVTYAAVTAQNTARVATAVSAGRLFH
jgi:hypothetical protein